MTHSAEEPALQQLFDLTGRTALVTGGCGYLGTALARALAEAGASVIISSRDGGRAAEAAAALPGTANHYGVALDHLDDESLGPAFRSAVDCTGRLDVLVNNGHEGMSADWTTVTGEQFTRQLANATGYFLLGRLFREHVVERGGTGSLILLGSMYGVVGSYPEVYEGVSPASPVAYHALKGGIAHMTRHLAVYWAKDGVRVNCLSPGPFPKPEAPAELVDRICAKSPMGRIGRPHELKGAVVFLASEASGYVTGHNLLVDGGWTAW